MVDSRKYTFLFVMVSALLIFSITAISASDIQDNNGTLDDVVTVQSADSTNVVETTDTTYKENTNDQKTDVKSVKTVKTTKKVKSSDTLDTKDSTNNDNTLTTLNNKKSLKTKDVSVNSYDDLKSNITSFTPTDEDKTLSITLNQGTYTVTDTIVLNSETKFNLSINGNGQTIDGSSHQFLAIGSGFNVTIANLTITNANATNGGAINTNGTLTVENVSFINNNATQRGGAIYGNNQSTVTVNNATFDGNNMTTLSGSNRNDYGGAAIYTYGKLSVNNSVFNNNYVSHNDQEPGGDGGAGGAIVIYNNQKEILIANSTFTKNQARHGGVILIYNSTNTKLIDNCVFENNTGLYGMINAHSSVNITNSKFINNNATGNGSAGRVPRAGALLIMSDSASGSSLIVESINNTFINNTANDGQGGAIGLDYVGSTDQMATSLVTIVKNNTFINNTAKYGGAISDKRNLTITDSVFEGNNATYGGAVYVTSTTGNLTASNVTFTNNTADYHGGAIYSNQTTNVNINNATFTGNQMTTLIGSTANSYGGGAIAVSGALTVNNSKFDGNIASHRDVEPNGNGGAAGAIEVSDTTQDILIANSTFTHNEGRHGSSVTLSNATGLNTVDNCVFDNNSGLYGTIDTYSDLNITNTNFTNNMVTGEGSGGRDPNGAAVLVIANDDVTPTVTIVNSNFINNTANGTDSVGGAICASKVHSSNSDEIATITIKNSTFINNTATYGGAINNNNGLITVIGSVFENNSATLGGVVMEWDNTVTIDNSSFVNNSAYAGGVIFVNNGNSTIENSTLINNTADFTGSVLYGNDGNSTVKNSTMINNTVADPTGSVINNWGETTSENNTFVGNLIETTTVATQPKTFGTNATITIPISISLSSKYTVDVFNGTVTVIEGDNVLATFDVTNSTAGVIEYNYSYTTSTTGNHTLVFKFSDANNNFRNSSGNITFNVISGTSFTYLQSLIDNLEASASSPSKVKRFKAPSVLDTLESGNTLVLDRNYTWDATYDENMKNGITITQPITINGNGFTINATGTSRIFNVTSDLTLTNVILVGGSANYGGAIYVGENGRLKLQNVTFIDNNATQWGGAIYADNTTTLIIDNATFINNQMTTTDGAIANDYGGGAIATSGKITVTNSIFDGNIASHRDVEPNGDGGSAGAILIIDDTQDVVIADSTFTHNEGRHGSSVTFQNATGSNTVDNCVFDNNTGLYGTIKTTNSINVTNTNFTNNIATGNGSGGRQPNGAGILVMADSSIYATPVLLSENNNFINNSADKTYDGVGGAIAVAKVSSTDMSEIATLIVKNNNFVNNTATYGGAISNNNGVTNVTGSVFDGNSADYGGAVMDWANTVTIDNSTFTNNTATEWGGVIALYDGNTTLENSTIVNNSASNGGVIYSWSATKLELNNNTVKDNTVTDNSSYIIRIGDVATIESNTFINNTIDGEDRLISNIGTVSASGNVYESNNLETTITADTQNITFDGITFNATVTVDERYNTTVNSGNVTVTINGVELNQNFTVVNGTATITIPHSSLSNSTNDVQLFYVPENDDYQGSNTTVDLNGIPTRVDVDDVTTIVNQTANVIITVVANDGNKTRTITNQNVTIEINGTKYNATIGMDGKATFAYTPVTSGTVEAIITYDGDGIYANSTKTISITAEKQNTTLNILGDSEVKTGPTNITISLTDGTNPIDGQTINITVAGDDFTYSNIVTTNTSGEATLPYIYLDEGTFTITATFNGTDFYASSTNTTTVTATNVSTTLIITPNATDVKVGDSINFTISVTDGTNPVSGIVYLTIGNDSDIVFIGKDGINYYNYTVTKEGTYNVVAKYEGDVPYAPSTNTTSFTATRTETTLTVTPNATDVKTGDMVSITVTLTAGTTPISGQVVNVTINGKTQEVLIFDGEGVIENFLVLDEGTYDITAIYYGDDTYVNSTANSSFTATKTNTTLTVTTNATDVKTGDMVDITVTLTNGTDGIPAQAVNITIDGVNYTVITNETGMAVLKNVTAFTEGTYDVVATFTGDAMYVGSTNTTSFTATKTNTTLVVTTNATEVNVPGFITINVTVTTETGYLMPPQEVTVKVNDNEYLVILDEEGKGSIENFMVLDEGTYNIVAEFAGDAYYVNSTNTTSFKASKIATNITIENADVVNVNTTSPIKVTLTDVDGNPLANKTITLSINGTLCNITTDDNGVATCSTFTPENIGTYTIVATFDGDISYVNSTNSSQMVSKIATKIALTDLQTVKINETQPITITLYDNNDKRLSDKTITLTINGVSTDYTTDSRGEVSIDYTEDHAGNMTIVVTFAGDEGYINSSADKVVEILRYDTNITIADIDNVKVNNKTQINATLVDEKGNKLSNKTVTVTVGDDEFTLKTNENGTISLDYTPKNVGELAIIVKYDGDENYYVNSSANKTVTVQQLATTITVEANNTKINRTTPIVVTLVDELGNGIAGQNVSVSINDTVVTLITDENGTATYNYVPLTTGNVTINATYAGNTSYINSTSSNVNIDINITKTSLTLDVNDTKINRTTPIVVTLVDELGYVVVDKNVTIYINGEEVANVTTDENGMATYEYVPSTTGEVEIKVVFAGDLIDEASNATKTIDVTKIGTLLNLTTEGTVKVNQTTPVTVTLYDEYGNTVAGQIIHININGTTYSVITNENGTFVYNYIPSANGVIDVEATYDGNDVYVSSTNSSVVEINKINTYVLIEVETANVSVKPGEQVNVTVSLIDEKGNPIRGQDIYVYLVAENNATIKTDSLGMATLYYYPQTIGNVTIYATYDGTTVYNGNSTYRTIEVNAIDTSIMIDAHTTAKVGELVDVTVILLDNEGKELVNKTITLTVNGVTSTVKINEYGYYYFNYTPSEEGTVTIVAAFGGDYLYNNSTNTSTIEVNKTNTKLTITTDDSVIVDHETSVTVVLTDEDGNVLEGKTVYLVYDGNRVEVTTDAQGVATQNIVFATAGEKTIEVVFDGDNLYNNSTATSTITVVRNSTKLTLTTDDTVNVNQTTPITVVLADVNGDVLSGQIVNININGTTYSVVTNENGTATYNYIPVAQGTITIVATYDGNNVYVNSTDAADVVISKIDTSVMMTVNVTDSMKVGETANIVATLKDANGNVLRGQTITLRIGTEDVTLVTDELGNVEYDYTSTATGNVTIYAIYDGTTVYNVSSTYRTIEVNEIDTMVSIWGNETAKVGQTIAQTIVLTDLDFSPIANKTITLTVNGVTSTVKTDEFGCYSFDLTPSEDGTVTITAVFDGDYLYNNSTYTKTIEVSKYNTTIKVTADSTKVNKTTTVTVVLTDEEGNALEGKTVSIIVGDNVEEVTTDAQGTATLDKVFNVAGEKTIEVVFDGDNVYVSSENETTITVSKLATTMVVSNVTVAYGESIKLTAKITDENGNAVNGGIVAFKLNGITMKDENGNVIYANVVNGVAEITVANNYKSNNYEISAVYGGTTSAYESVRASGATLSLVKANVSMSVAVNTTTAKAGENITVTTTITSTQGTVNTGKVVLKLNGISLKDEDGNVIYGYVQDGKVVMDVKLPENLKSDTYTITAVYGGSNYNRGEATTTITTLKHDVNVNISPVTVARGQDAKISATITDENGNLVTGTTKVSIKLNGKTQANVVATNGVIDTTISTSTLTGSEYVLTVVAGKNSAYNSDTVDTSLTITG